MQRPNPVKTEAFKLVTMDMVLRENLFIIWKSASQFPLLVQKDTYTCLPSLQQTAIVLEANAMMINQSMFEQGPQR